MTVPKWLTLPSLQKLQPKGKPPKAVLPVKPKAPEQIHYQRKNPIVKPSLMPGTLYHKPLPRLHPQPMRISMMIKKRIKARQRRMDETKLLKSWLDDCRKEIIFERHVEEYVPGFKMEPTLGLAAHPILSKLKANQECFEREIARIETPYSPKLLETLAKAKKQKIAVMTRRKRRRAALSGTTDSSA